MLDWKKPELSDGSWIRKVISKTEASGSDVSFANIYLLRNKYDIEICRYRDSLIRKYYGQGARCGYTFPLGEVDLGKALEELDKDAKSRGEELRFAFVTEDQKQLLDELMPGRFAFLEDQADSDYIYSRQELADLSGKAFHKKKNHVSRFGRMYPDYEYSEMGCANWEDAGMVADAWYYEHLQQEDLSQLKEYQAIKEAINYFDELELSGGIVYVNQVPVAMTIGSMINENVCDVHFEKAIGEWAANGGYAVINRMFAKQLADKKVMWLNREEDIGIEGLRKAKMSYRPKMLLKKYSAVSK